MIRPPLKILMLASSYPRSNEDTASIFLRYLAENLSARGIQIQVLAPADRKGGTRIENNVRVHRFGYSPATLQKLAYGSGILSNLKRMPWLWIQVPFFLIAMTSALIRLIRKQRPDVIHAHWILPQGLIAVLSKYFHTIPVIATAHGTDAFALQNKFAQRIKRFVVAKSDAWTANTHATSEALGKLPCLSNLQIIPMGVDAEFFARGSAASLRGELPENEFVVLFVGRLIENKGCRDFLDAVSLLPESIAIKTTLWIVGDGYDRSNLEQYAKGLHISDKVRFWGSVRNDLLPDFYAAADLFVAPSVQTASGEAEGQNVALLEASAARACVLATRIGGISEFVKDGITGVLVEPGNPRELAAAMEKLLLDAPLRLRLAENALLEVKNRYDWRQIAAEFEQLYRQVVEGGRSTGNSSRIAES